MGIKETNYCFADQWYENISVKIFDAISKNKNSVMGYVYFVRIEGTNKVKIGFSYDIISRVKSFKTTITDKIGLDGFIYCSDFVLLEKKIHAEKSERNISNEWFSLSKDECKLLIKNNNGFVSNCFIDNVLYIDNGHVLRSNIIINEDYSTEINNVITRLKDYFEIKKEDYFLATPTDIKNKFFETENILIKDIKKILISRGIKRQNQQRYVAFNGSKSNVGTPYLLDRKFIMSL